MPRRALLLGMDDYNDPSLRLGAPGNDTAAMAETLSNIGYPKDGIKTIKSSDLSLSTSTLRREIRHFLEGCKANDEVLIYFSGHGVEQNGERLWIPADYYKDDPLEPDGLVGDSYLYAMARRSKARSVVYVVDACREGVKFTLAASKGLPAESGEAPAGATQDAPSVAIVFSCRQGEKAKAEPKGLSYFTRALCEVLGMNDERALLCEVLPATDEALGRLLAEARLPRYSLQMDERPIHGRGGDPNRLLIKENVAARLQQRMRDSAWCKAVQQAALWQRVRESEHLALQVLHLVLHAEALVLDAERTLPGQRWLNRDYPMQFVRHLESLTGGGATLSPPEAALAVAAPYVYEAVLANGQLVLARSGNPLDPFKAGKHQQPGAPWLALRNAFQSQEAFARRRALLAQQGYHEAVEDLAAWQLQRFLHRTGDLWEFPVSGRSGWASDALASVFEVAPFKEVRSDRVVSRLWTGKRLVRFARAIFQAFEDIELERGDGFDPDLRVGSPAWPVNEPALAHLVALAAGLAVDPRRLSPMLADHIGMADLFTAEKLKKVLDAVEWHSYGPHESEMALCLVSPHEVVDAALEDFVGGLEMHRARLTLEGPLARVPRRFDARNLKPASDPEGRALYQKPHLRLTQDEAKVRELLMGKQLYGDPAMALRELYQNAMDACRYRRARVEWQRGMGRTIPDYAGLIVFRAGHENGRAFIECSDNGIGMAERHLQRQFARAGQRFTDSHEFHLEKARWEEAGITFTPNSRFGIGVYSYFMLADEIFVETKRLHENCIDSELGLSAKVVGSGSLFRLRRAEAIPVGTRVRLYLNEARYLDSLLDDVFKWLWIPEFEVMVHTLNGNTVRLPAGEPTRGLLNEAGRILPIPESAGRNGQPRVFWALDRELASSSRDDETVVLSDGIFTTVEGPRTLPSVIVNLTEDYRPELSVDRDSVTDWDKGYRWAREQIALHGWKYLLQVPGINFVRLAELASDHLESLTALDRQLRAQPGGTQHLPFWNHSKSRRGIDLSGVGLSRIDLWMRDIVMQRTGAAIEWHQPLCVRAVGWRLAELMHAGLPLSEAMRQYAAFSETGHRQLDLPSSALLLDAGDDDEELVRLSLSAIVNFAAKHDLSIGTVLALAQPLAGIGLPIPALSGKALDLTPTSDLCELFSPETAVNRRSADEITLGTLVFAAGTWRKSLRQVLEMAQPLALVGFALPSVPEAALDHVPDHELFSFSSLWRYGSEHPSLPRAFESGMVSIRVLLSASKQEAYGLANTLAQLKPLADIGIEVPVLDSQALAALETDEVCKKLLLLRFQEDAAQWFSTDQILPSHLAVAAGNASMSLGALLARTQPLAALGVVLPEIPDAMHGMELDDLLLRLVSRDVDSVAPWSRDLSLVRCVRMAAKYKISVAEVLQKAGVLAALGFTLPHLSAEKAQYTPDDEMGHFLSVCGGIHPIEGDRLTWRQLTGYSDQFRADCDSLAELVAPLRDIGIAVELPRAPGFPLLQVLRDSETRGNSYGACDLALYCNTKKLDPALQHDALAALQEIGWNVEEALAFADYCATSR